jgi:ABC-type glycerol-3-phosphate transport system substrate-binding protein
VWESLSEAQAERLVEDIQTFQEEFPQFTVIQQHYDSPENFMTPLMAGEIDFDVVLASPVLLGSLRATQKIAPMSDFFPPSFIDGFAAVTLQGATQTGQLWGIPDTTGFHLLLFYNRDLIDTPPADTAELWELAKSSQGEAGTVRWGLGVNSYEPLWLVPWLSPYGGWLTDESGQPAFDTPAIESALDLHLSWLGRSSSHESDNEAIAPVATYEEVRAQFLTGDMAMMIDGEWAIVELAQTETIDWGVAPLPNVSLDEEDQPAVPLVLARYWAISRSVNGDQAPAAAAFVEFITRPERQLAWTTQFGLLPTRRQALNATLINDDPALRVNAEQMRAGRMVPLGTNANTLLNSMRDPLRQVIDGELTPGEAAEMMQQETGN